MLDTVSYTTNLNDFWCSWRTWPWFQGSWPSRSRVHVGYLQLPENQRRTLGLPFLPGRPGSKDIKNMEFVWLRALDLWPVSAIPSEISNLTLLCKHLDMLACQYKTYLQWWWHRAHKPQITALQKPWRKQLALLAGKGLSPSAAETVLRHKHLERPDGRPRADRPRTFCLAGNSASKSV